jgi:hypothetical protein
MFTRNLLQFYVDRTHDQGTFCREAPQGMNSLGHPNGSEGFETLGKLWANIGSMFKPRHMNVGLVTEAF